jgi:23S rRNA (cytosine1962-C5)-methyltransferase
MSTEPKSVVLRRGRAKPVWFGHPWVFSEAIERADALEPGDEVRVLDHDGRFIGRGFANPRSQIRVRVAALADLPLDGAWIAGRIADARDLRNRLGLPSDTTDAYRLVNSEGDALPGLVVDVFGDAAVVQHTTFAMKQREGAILEGLRAALGERVRTFYEAAAGGVAQIEGFVSSARVMAGEPRSKVRCLENGFLLDVEPLSGQKTGWFVDQRENRAAVGRLARGMRMLDLYCYAGGFGLAAAKGGAVSVHAVDVSARALERCRDHFELNGLAPPEIAEDDVFRWLERAPAGAFDLIVCDPPKFARARKDLEAALKGYRRLNALAMQAASPGAILCTASCSQLVDAVEFERMLASAAKDAHRRLQVLTASTQAPDHVVPVAFPEGRYLKFFICRVE